MYPGNSVVEEYRENNVTTVMLRLLVRKERLIEISTDSPLKLWILDEFW